MNINKIFGNLYSDKFISVNFVVIEILPDLEKQQVPLKDFELHY
jgi:hypothetical protein